MPDHVRVFEAIAAKNPIKAEQAMSELIVLARADTPISRNAERRRAR
jgi:DNA-binding FadR family transcriptional regulator